MNRKKRRLLLRARLTGRRPGQAENFVSHLCHGSRLSLYLQNIGCGSAVVSGKLRLPLATTLAFHYICTNLQIPLF